MFILKPTDNLFRAPFLADQCLDLMPDVLINARTCLRVTPRHRQRVSLFGAVASQPPIALKFPADIRSVTPQQLGNLCLAIFGFLQDINLVSFLLGKLRVATDTCSSYFGRLEKAALLPQLALLPTGRVALTN